MMSTFCLIPGVKVGKTLFFNRFSYFDALLFLEKKSACFCRPFAPGLQLKLYLPPQRGVIASVTCLPVNSLQGEPGVPKPLRQM